MPVFAQDLGSSLFSASQLVMTNLPSQDDHLEQVHHYCTLYLLCDRVGCDWVGYDPYF